MRRWLYFPMLPMDSTRRGVLFQSSFDTRLSRREISALVCSYSSVSHKQQVSQVKEIIKLEASKNCSESQCGVQSDFMSAATKPQPFPLSLYPFPFPVEHFFTDALGYFSFLNGKRHESCLSARTRVTATAPLNSNLPLWLRRVKLYRHDDS